jgi:hypothetical protein
MVHIIERRSGFRIPHAIERCGVVLMQKLTERCYSNLEIWNETRVELHETKKFSNVANNHWQRPMLKKLVLGHRRAVSVGAYVDPNEFELLREDDFFRLK